MDANPELCSRCGEDSVAYDDTGGCYVCQSCGFVASDQALLSCPEVTTLVADEKANTAGRTCATAAVAYKIQGGGSGAYASGPYDTHIAAAVRSAADPAGQSRARRQRRDLDGLQALAGTLRLSGPITQLAAGYLARIHSEAEARAAAVATTRGKQVTGTKRSRQQRDADVVDGAQNDDEVNDNEGDDEGEGDSGNEGSELFSVGDDDTPSAAQPSAAPVVSAPALGGCQSAARLGALLYLASRSEGGSLTLAEVAQATCTDMYRVGELARQQAAFLRLSLPAVDVERFVIRMALELVASGQLPTLPHAGAGQGDLAAREHRDVGAAAAHAPPSETALRAHPLVRRSTQLTGLVVRQGWHEGRTPRTVAGALLSICLDALYPPKSGPTGGAGGGGRGGPLHVNQVARSAMCAVGQLSSLKQEILSQLLALAARACLPFAPLLAPGNVAHYLDVIIAAEGMLCAQP